MRAVGLVLWPAGYGNRYRCNKMKENIIRNISIVLFFTFIIGGFTNAFANSYSRELNVIMKKKSPSSAELANFIDNQTTGLDADAERAIATGLFDKVKDSNAVVKLERLTTDVSSNVRIATILPLLAHNKEELACLVFKNEIIKRNGFSFGTPTPFYAPNDVGADYKLNILKKNQKFLTELLNALRIKELDKMLKLRIAVTVHFLNKKEIARKTAREILQEKDNTVAIVSWAEWILRDFK